MKVALLSRWMWEENRRAGGPQSQGGTAQQLAEALQERGHEVLVLTQCDPKKESGGGEGVSGKGGATAILRRTTLGKLEVWETPRWRRSWMASPVDKALKLVWGHRKALTDATDLFEFLKRRGPFDVLWAQCEEPDGVVAGLADMISIVPPIFTHTYALRYTFPDAASPRPRFTDIWPLRFAYSRSRIVAANSPLVATHISRDYGTPAGKVRVLPHNLTRAFLEATAGEGTGEPARSPDTSDSAAISPEPGRVLFLGALNRKKGALEFAEAARLLGYRTGISGGNDTGNDAVAKPSSLSYTFVVIGGATDSDAAYAREWQTAVDSCKGIATLEMPGKLPAEAVIREIRRASVVVVPSLFDEWNRALVEALALGRPVVTTTGVGAHYLPQRDGSGIAINLPDEAAEDDDYSAPAALAEAIARVASDPAYLAAAKRSAAAIRAEFSPQTIAAQLEALLEETIRTKTR